MAVNATAYLETLSSYTFENFSFWEYISTLQPIAYFVIAMTFYAVLVFHFYRFLARKDILKLRLNRYTHGFSGFFSHFFSIILYIFENLILVPFMVFVWFGVLSGLLIIVSHSQTITQIMLSSVAVVATVRITAYYKEELSKDLAKMIPFALLGIFIIDQSFLSIEGSISLAQQFAQVTGQLGYYLLFLVILEFFLRALYLIRVTLWGHPVESKDED